MTKGVIFDMDGLLLDSERPILEAWLAYSHEHQLLLTREMYLEVVGRNGTDAKKLLESQLGPGFHYEEVRAQIAQRLSHLQLQGFPLKPYALNLLNFLQERNVPCSVATSTNLAVATKRLEMAGILPYFRQISGGDEVARGKPEPDLFLLAAQRLQIPPNACLVFEDSAYGARGAHAAGMSVIVVPDLKPAPQDVREFSLTVVPTLKEAIPIVENWLKS